MPPCIQKQRTIHFAELRSDWYAGADFMARALQRRFHTPDCEPLTFAGFPRQWVPLFEWAGVRWHSSAPAAEYIPFISGMSETATVREVERARRAGQLRLLVETVASAEVVLSETLQRIDCFSRLPGQSPENAPSGSRISLTNWHSYSRPELRAYDEALTGYRQQHENAIFLPCGRTRPYTKSRTHYRLRSTLRSHGVEFEDHDIIVMTSIGPVPETLWNHDLVIRYDTGVRDVYRILVLLRRLLQGVTYAVAWDCLCFRPYRDVLEIVSREGRIGRLARPAGLRGRNVPTYRTAVVRRATLP